MVGTYSQHYVQIVFAVKDRENLIDKSWKEELNKYISGIITAKKQKSIIVNGMPDHIHLFVGLRPSIAPSDLVRDVKNNSSNFINKYKFVKHRFSWQEGFGIFSYSHSQVQNVYNYILNQEQHHKRQSFRQEYLEILNKYEVDYEEKYLFDWIDF